MKINNLDYAITFDTDSDRLYAAGSADTYAYTSAGPGAGLADAAGYAVGQSTLAMTFTHALAQESQRAQNSYGSAVAYAYGASAKRIEESYAASASRYRSASNFSRIVATSSFSSHG